MKTLPAIKVNRNREPLPLSFAQQRLWFLTQMGGMGEAYHAASGLHLRGYLDCAALRRAFNRIMARHEVLRSTFALVDGKPMLHITPAGHRSFLLLEHDLRGNLDPDEALKRLVAEEGSAKFDLECGPLIRGRLICLGEEEHVLLITMHHIVSDGWSSAVLGNELSALYAAFAQGKADPLPSLSLQYADYAAWQHKWIAGEILQQQAEYWKSILKEAPAFLVIPADRVRPPQQDYAGAWVEFALNEELTRGLKALSQRHGTTLFMTMLAAFTALLARLSGQQDLVLGCPVANRGRAEIEELIGFFVNTLALRFDLSGSPTVAELLARVKTQTLAAQQNQDIPFEQVVEIVRPDRSLAHSPLFQVMFAWQNTPQGAFRLPGLEVIPLGGTRHVAAKFDLTLSLQEADSVITGGLEYATSLFDRSTVERYLCHFHVLLTAMVDDDTRTIERLPLLTGAERHQILRAWNATQAEYPRERCIHELFQEQVEKTPEAVAVVFQEASLRYAELNRQANQLGHYLRKLGVRPDARVAICVERGMEMIVALLAVLKAGGAYVPLDPAYPAERLRYMLEDSAPVVLLTQAHLHGRFTQLPAPLPVIDLTDLSTSTPPWKDEPQTNPDLTPIGLTPLHLAYVIYTSGSTGTPKGVMVEHRNLANLIHWHVETFALQSGCRSSSLARFGFDAAAWEIWPTLCAGAVLVLPSSTDTRDSETLLSWWETQKLDVSFLPTPLAELAFTRDHANSHLRTLFIGGDRLRHLPVHPPPFSVVNLYGPAETTVASTSGEVGGACAVLSIGRPIANTRIYILNAQGQPVPVGVAGELYIGGVQVARGYLNRPELTAERFLTDPFADETGARMYKTGDLGRWLSDGTIEFLGRNDFQVKIRGFRIELGEIEARLMEHAGVREAVVVARQDTPGDKRLVAYYTSAGGSEEGAEPTEEKSAERRDERSGAAEESVGAEQLRRYLSMTLPEYMVPAAYVRLQALPLTPNGKLDRKALPAPETDAYAVHEYEAPQGEMETQLAAIWAEVLKLDRVGRHDNFFQLGGHSLLAVTLIERMRQRGMQIDVRALFATPTVAELATLVGVQANIVVVPPNRIPADCQTITPEMLPLVQLTAEEIQRILRQVPGGAANLQDIYPLTPLQEGILFHHLMGAAGEGDPYLMADLVSFQNRSRLEEFVSALQAVIARHDILRTAVLWEGLPEPVQVVQRHTVLPVEEVTLDATAGDLGKQLYARYDPRRHRIDVRQAPLLRLYIAYDTTQERWLMMLLLHHLAGDHTTVEAMLAEVQAHLLGRASELPAPLPFRNLVAQARLGVSQEEHTEYFRKLLGDVEEPTAPFGLLDVQGDGTGIGEACLELDSALALRLRERARKLGVSAASLCHLAWAQVLARVSGREDVVFGTVLLGRMQGGEGSDRVLGMFVNTLPIRIRVGEEEVERSVREVHRQLGRLMRHEHASLALAQRCSRVPAPAPLFSSLLNYRHSPLEQAALSPQEKQAWTGIEMLYGEERTNYPFTLSVDDLGKGFRLTAQVEAGIEAQQVCGYMQQALESLVDALETASTRAVRRLEVLPQAERHKVLVAWNATQAEYPRERCIHELFQEQVEKTPEAVAVVFQEASLRYAELNRQANQLGHYLRKLGVRPDARVAICVERGMEMIVALLAVLKAGGAYVPLDPAYPAERLRYMLEDSAPVVLLTQAHLHGRFTHFPAPLPVIDLADLSTSTPPWKDEPQTNPDLTPIGLTPLHLAYVIYTSGSTGTPKGVMNEHRGVVNRLIWMQNTYELDPHDAVLQKTPFSFDVSVWEFFWPLLNGARLVMARPEGHKDPSYLAESIRQKQITTMHFVPSMLQAFLEHAEQTDEVDCSSLVRVVCSGEALPTKLARRFQEWLPKASLHNLYGPTEAAVDVTAWTCSGKASPSSIPIGRPIANTRIYILDAQGEPVPVGVAGELYIGGVQVARGYLNRPELTAERFLTDPFADEAGARMYKTGDLGRWLSDGTIEFLGRNDFQVKIRGFRIELGEIEARLMEHAGVRQAVVVAREDTPGDKRLVAYYTSAGGSEEGAEPTEEKSAERRDERSGAAEESVGAEQLRRYLSMTLPEYMVPAAYVRLQALPLTPNGKLDRKALPAPETDAYAVHEYEAPQGEMETQLAAIWAEVLKLDRVGRHDNFFQLGGHSLLAVTLIERMRQRGMQIDVRALFATPTVAELATLVGVQANIVVVPPNRIPADCQTITPEMLPLVQLTAEEIQRILRQVPGGAANLQDIYPLTPLQEGILFHHLMGAAGEGDPYLMADLVSFQNRSRLEEFVSALQAVIARHDILRTAVLWEGLPEPVQVVQRHTVLPVEEVTLDATAGDLGKQLYARYDPRRHRIDVRQAPLLRLYIAYDTTQERWLMMLLLHHLAGDHTTVEAMLAEVQAHLLGRASELPAPLPFRNLVAQARLGVSQEEHTEYFRKLLGDVEEPTAPFGLLDVQGDGTGIGEACLELDSALALRLRERARKLGVSAASLCHLAWAQVLARVSGREDVVFGTVLLGRMQGGEGSDRVLGMFVNTLPIRIRVGEEEVERSVREVHRQLGRLMRHEHASLALAQRCSRVPAPAPLFSSLLNYRHSPLDQAALSPQEKQAWTGIEMLYGEERTNYPFTLSVDDLGKGFRLTAQVEAGIEAQQVCGYMQQALESLVDALETASTRAVRRLEVLPQAERHKVLVAWNATQAEYPRERCIHELFQEQVEKTPEAVAVVFQEASLRYAELNRQANQLGHYLRKLGVRPDARVAICVERGMEMIVALLAVLKAGGAYVPLDPAYPAERLRYMLEDSAPVVLLTQAHLHGRFTQLPAPLPVIDLTDLSTSTPPWKDEPQTNPDLTPIGLTPLHLAYVIYTSGSTGTPKGVMNEHRGVVNRLIWMQNTYELDPHDAVLQKTPFSFDVSVWEFFWPLLNGARLVMARPEGHKDPSYLAESIRQKQITTMHFVPSMLQAFLEHAEQTDEVDCSSLVRVVCSGEALPTKLARRFQEWLPKASLHNLYGPTEAAVDVTAWTCSGKASPSSIPIGRPIANTRIYILDAQGEPVPVGVAGELYIGGVQVARGYLNRPELTAERFLTDPFADEAGARMYKTGDLGRWLSDGTIEFLGRNDFQVKIRGFRIELGEIEARLMEHAGVRQAVVVAREDTPGDKRLVAYYTSAGGSEEGAEPTEEKSAERRDERSGAAEESVGAEQLRRYLSMTLPEYMVPAAYVRLQALPLTPNGKLDRKALPAPETDAYAVHEYEAPQGEMETQLAAIWAEVLKLDRVGRHDNFFQLGGHSLLAVTLIERMRRVLKIEMAIVDLFARPALADFASGLENAAHIELPSIVRAERGARMVLSFAQQRLWFLAQLEGVSQAYHIPSGLRLRGKLNRSALGQALDRILARHEVLRTTFTLVDGQPVQRISPPEQSRFQLLQHDLRQHREANTELHSLIAQEANTPFDFEHGPLIRGRLICLGEEEHVLLITMHHIVSDGWSMGVLSNELSTLYSAFVREQADPLPSLNLQYADYAAWQRQWIAGDILQQQADYWKNTLVGAPTVLDLPADHPRPAQQEYAGAFLELVLDDELTKRLKALSHRHGITLFMTLLAGWAALLARLSGQTDVVIGTPMANRSRSEIEGLIGFFVNTLALRLDLSGSPTVNDLLARVKTQTLAAQQNQDIPFEQVVEIVRPERSLAHSPLFQVMFAWQNVPSGRLDLPGLKIAPLEGSRQVTAKFDLTLSLQEAGSRIVGGVEYATSRFEQATMERYTSHFRRLLEGMVADETQVVERLPLLTGAERHQILRAWNATQAEYPRERCIHELFQEQVEKTPEAVAVVFQEASLRYAELNRQANQLGHYLRKLGVRPDARVAICVERGMEMIVALLAVLKAGGAYVPLDPAYPAERLRYMLEDSAPVVLLTQAHLHGRFTHFPAPLPVIDLADLSTSTPPWKDEPQTNPDLTPIGLTPLHLAYVIYTSGSTGTPKGVMNEHRGVVNRLIWMQNTYELDPHDAVLQKTPFSFDVSVWEFFWPLLNGARLVMARPEGHKDPSYLAESIRQKQITTMHFVPSMLQAFLEHAEQTDEVDCSSLVRVVCSGEALPTKLARRFQEWLPKASLHNLYGPTEAAVDVTAWTCSGKASPSSIPIGRPIANTRIYILDAQGEPVPVGVAGELYIGGVQVARGYLNRPELTAERFLTDPFADEAGARMYKTGDLGRWLSDGTIEFLGRNDFQVKIRGFRIELGEIEARLMEHAGVRQAVVVAREDTPGDKRLVAYYTSAGGSEEGAEPTEEKSAERRDERSGAAEESVGAEQLRRYLSMTLPEYMVPAAYVRLQALPLTPNGKLDRKALPAPETDAYAVHEYEAPQGEMETQLAAIWAEVLKLDRVGRHDNFFQLGGHSLLAVTLIERMRQRGMQIDVRALFATPTVAELATLVGVQANIVVVPPNRIPADCQTITPEMLPLVQLTAEEIQRILRQVPGGAANLQDIYPLTPLQEGILFHHLMGAAGEGDPYLMADLVSFQNRSRLEEFVSALQAVIARHDILRTAVLWEGLPEPVQVVQRHTVLPVEEVTLDATAGDLGKQLYARYDPRRHRIDVRQAPLLRLYIAYDTTQERWLMMLLNHHLADDNTALRMLRAEVQAHLLGRASELPAPLPFRNLVAQARLGVSQEEHTEYFRKLLGDVEEPTAPFGLLDVQGDGTGIGEACLELDSALALRLRERARKLGVSAASLCHLAWAQVLARVSGREDVVFGTVLLGRMQGGEGSDRVLGPFINTLPVRIHVGEEGSEASVRGVHKQLVELMRHEHASLALAQRCSRVPAPAPLFSSLLNYRHSPLEQAALSPQEKQAWTGIEMLYGEERTNYPFTLSVDDLGKGFRLTAQVEAGIEAQQVCGYMQQALESLVDALETASTRAVRRLEVLPQAERHKVLVAWNATQAEYPRERCIHELFQEQVEKTPEAVAVVFQEASLRYAELNRQANQLGHYLRKLGVRPDARVAICVERGMEMIVALLAVLKAGGAYVPLDPAYPAERLRYMLEDSAPVVLLTQAHLHGRFTQLPAPLPVIDLTDLSTTTPPWKDEPQTNPDLTPIGLTPLHLAYVIYTSGSTGTPKGVMVEHRNLANLIHWHVETFALQSGCRSSSLARFGFDAAAWEIWPTLCAGAVLVLPSSTDTRDSETLLSWWETQKLDVSFLPTPLAELAFTRDHANSHLRTLFIGGDRLRHLPVHPPPFSVVNLYGPAETTVASTSGEVGGACAVLSIGRPIANTRIYILNAQGQPVPVGVAGELYIGGAGVARGYLNRPELTAERFLTDPFADEAGARMYKTGDLGRWLSDGTIEFLGRNDFQVKIRGFRIELGEIEARLMEHAGVREAVVVARQDTPGDKRLVAYATLHQSYQSNHLPELQRARIAGWQELYESTYAQPAVEDSVDSVLDFVGWTSSYTGQSIPRIEMQEWLDNTLARVLALKPNRVLEIGCGSGLLLFPLAGQCAEYVGTDFSNQTLQHLRRKLSLHNIQNVQLLHRTADDFSGLEANRFDTVILNSVIQYFPDADYLRQVLGGILQVLSPGGHIFLGDVRNLRLLEAFHASVQLYQAEESDHFSDIRKRTRRAIAREEELCVAPSFFLALQNQFSKLGSVQLLPKLGKYHNEITKYRYDAILHLDTMVPPSNVNPLHLDWNSEALTTDKLQKLLTRQSPEAVLVRNITNTRVIGDAKVWETLQNEDAPSLSTVAELRRWQPDLASLDPELLVHMAEAAGYRVELSWRETDSQGSYQALFSKEPLGQIPLWFPQDAACVTAASTNLQHYTNDPLRTALTSQANEELKRSLKSRLPDYMVPSQVVILDELPLTPNGKLDRKALPAPETDAYAVHEYEAPQGEMETQLAAIWTEVLKLDRVGRHDNFFQLGGHSLLAVTLIERMRRVLKIEMAIVDLFARPALADFASGLENAAHIELPSIVRAERGARMVLSFAQQRLWFLAQLEGVSQAYHIPSGLRLRGKLNRSALGQALDRILARHEVLRTTFTLVDGQPVQRISPPEQSRFQLLQHDLRQHREANTELHSLIAQEANTPFDFEHGPLIRGRLICLGEEEHVLLITMHHIVSDGWSMGVLSNELSTLYSAFVREQADPLPSLNLQYADYAAWQRQWIAGDILQQQADYWKNTLVGAPTVLDLPADHPRPAQQEYAGAFLELVLDDELTKRLKALSHRHGITLFMTLLAGWAALLARLSGQTDVVIGTPMANRSRSEIEGLIGFFVNTLALRLDLSGSPTVNDLLARVKTQTLAAQQNQDIPFEQVVEIVRPERSLAHSPLFQVMFAWQNVPSGRLDLPGLKIAPLEGSRQVTAKFDLTLSLQEAGSRIVGGVEYATSRFEQATMERYTSHFRRLLEGMVADETQVVERLPLLTGAERHQILRAWNATQAEYPRERCIHELFQEQVEKTPEAVAVVFQEASLRYAELNRQANQLGHYLRKLGVRPDARVAICVERGMEMIVALLAVLKAGGAYVPLDPAYPAERLRYMLEDSAPVVLLTQAHLHGRFTQLPAPLPVIDLADLSTSTPPWKDEPQTNPDLTPIGLTPLHLAYVIYTSGSTGTPKGVMVEHRGLCNLVVVHSRYLAVDGNSRIVQFASFGFDGCIFEVVMALCQGASLHVPQQGEILVGEALSQFVTQHSITHAILPPAVLTSLSEQTNLLSGCTLIISGDVLSDLLARRWMRGHRLINGYGPTEVTICATLHDCCGEECGSPPIGRPIANTRIYILNAQGQPVPVGVAGELYIGGAGVARGYLNRPELTAERFLTDPFADEAGARMYKTGDLGRWLSDGTIEFLGRNDFQVKIRGFRIELGEIEARLMEHAGVRQAVVVARQDTPGDKRLVAYYTSAGGSEEGAEPTEEKSAERRDERSGAAEESVGAEQLRRYLSMTLPEYMVPAAYVRLQALPLTPNGKLDRKALPAPETDAYAVHEYEAPQGEMETQLAAIWAEVLKLDRVGRHDNFFQLGGHSLLTVRVVNLLKQAGINVSATDLFAHPTIESLATEVGSQEMRNVTDRAICIREDKGSPLFLVHCGNGELVYVPVLAAYIDTGIPIYGLSAQPEDEPQLQTIEGMATRLVRMIRSVQPTGPYRIAGWSFGGILAYEVAVQLIGADQKVNFLGLFDTRIPGASNSVERPPDNLSDKNQLLFLIQAGINVGEEQQAAIEEIKSSAARMDFAALVQKCRVMSLLPEQFIDFTAAQVKHALARAQAYYLANLHYSPERIPIHVHLFAAQGDNSVDSSLGWDAVVPKHLLRVLPVAGTHQSIMLQPNVATLGQVLSNAIRNASKDLTELPEKDYSPLVTLQTGRNKLASLFFVPGAGASVTTSVELVDHLSKAGPVYGLQPRGLDGSLVPHSTVASAAESYLRAISEIYPTGSVHLLGHSFGGWVVFEMAQRLLKTGRDIASLTILDSEAPDNKEAVVREYDRTEAIVKWIELIELMLGHRLNVERSDLDLRDEFAQRQLLHDRLVSVGILPRRSSPEALRGPLRTFAVSLRMHFRPERVYPGPVQLLLVDDPKLDPDANRREQELLVEGWKQWAPNLVFLRVPGNHMTVLKSPHVEVLAHIIRGEDAPSSLSA